MIYHKVWPISDYLQIHARVSNVTKLNTTQLKPVIMCNNVILLARKYSKQRANQDF